MVSASEGDNGACIPPSTLGCTKGYEKQGHHNPASFIQEKIGKKLWVAIQPHLGSLECPGLGCRGWLGIAGRAGSACRKWCGRWVGRKRAKSLRDREVRLHEKLMLYAGIPLDLGRGLPLPTQ